MLDRLDAALARADVVVLEVDAFDRRLPRRTDPDLLFHDGPVRELRAEMRVVEGHR